MRRPRTDKASWSAPKASDDSAQQWCETLSGEEFAMPAFTENGNSIGVQAEGGFFDHSPCGGCLWLANFVDSHAGGQMGLRRLPASRPNAYVTWSSLSDWVDIPNHPEGGMQIPDYVELCGPDNFLYSIWPRERVRAVHTRAGRAWGQMHLEARRERAIPRDVQERLNANAYIARRIYDRVKMFLAETPP